MATKTLIESISNLEQKLHQVAYRLLQDEMEAEDAVQDAIFNMIKAREPENSDEVKYRLFAILKNVCINKLRQRRSTVDISQCTDIGQEIEYDEVERLRPLLLSSLTPLQRKVFEMHTFDELEYEEIASKLKMSIESVRMNMSRARQVLRQRYKELER
ncbi:MAG: RNA polymerase sigma factor [Muribaculaceae bacterium]